MPARGQLPSDPAEAARVQASRDRRNRHTARQRELRGPDWQPRKRGRKPKQAPQSEVLATSNLGPIYESTEIPQGSTPNNTIRVASRASRQQSDTIHVAFRPPLQQSVSSSSQSRTQSATSEPAPYATPHSPRQVDNLLQRFNRALELSKRQPQPSELSAAPTFQRQQLQDSRQDTVDDTDSYVPSEDEEDTTLVETSLARDSLLDEQLHPGRNVSPVPSPQSIRRDSSFIDDRTLSSAGEPPQIQATGLDESESASEYRDEPGNEVDDDDDDGLGLNTNAGQQLARSRVLGLLGHVQCSCRIHDRVRRQRRNNVDSCSIEELRAADAHLHLPTTLGARALASLPSTPVEWKALLSPDEAPTVNFWASQIPSPPSLKELWDIDAIIAPIDTLAAHRGGFFLSPYPRPLDVVSQEAYIKIGGCRPHQTKHIRLGVGVRNPLIHTYVFFPRAEGRRGESLHPVVNDDFQQQWVDTVLLPAARATLDTAYLQRFATSFTQLKAVAVVAAAEGISGRGNPHHNKRCFIPERQLHHF